MLAERSVFGKMENAGSFKRIVVKIGTSTLTYENGRLNIRRMESLVRVLSDIKNSGTEVVLVSSGAVSAGASRLGLEMRARTTEEKQALAAVGQAEIMRMYERMFAQYGHTVAQILMTRDVVDDPHRLELIKGTFKTLFGLGCVPIVNENDSVSCEEIKFGGNDTLSAYVAIVSEAELLVNLSDINGLYSADPRKDPSAELISEVRSVTDDIMALAGGAGTALGTGGMATKLKAAKIVCDAGIPMIIMNGGEPSKLYSALAGNRVGTYFYEKERTE